MSDDEKPTISYYTTPATITFHHDLADFRRFGDRYLIPQRFTAVVQPGELDQPFLLTVHVVIEGRKPRCERLQLQEADPEHPVTAEQLRRVPLGRIVRQLCARVAHEIDAEGRASMGWLGVADEDLFFRGFEPSRRRREDPVDRDFLAKVAEVYREAVRQGRPPTQAVQRALGGPKGARSTAGRWVWMARKEGLLGPARPRQPGELPRGEQS